MLPPVRRGGKAAGNPGKPSAAQRCEVRRRAHVAVPASHEPMARGGAGRATDRGSRGGKQLDNKLIDA
jgi:hypothetical protein